MQKKAKAQAKKIELLKNRIVTLNPKGVRAVNGGEGTNANIAANLQLPLQPASYGCTL